MCSLAASSKPGRVDEAHGRKPALHPAPVWRETRGSLATACSQPGWGPGDLNGGTLECTGPQKGSALSYRARSDGAFGVFPGPALPMEDNAPPICGTAMPHSEKPSVRRGTRSHLYAELSAGSSVILCSSWRGERALITIFI